MKTRICIAFLLVLVAIGVYFIVRPSKPEPLSREELAEVASQRIEYYRLLHESKVNGMPPPAYLSRFFILNGVEWELLMGNFFANASNGDFNGDLLMRGDNSDRTTFFFFEAVPVPQPFPIVGFAVFSLCITISIAIVFVTGLLKLNLPEPQEDYYDPN